MSDNIVFTNNASALLAASINDTDTTVQVETGFGANFPSPTGDEYFLLTLEDDSGNIEIIKITGRSSDNLTMDSAADRGQDGTSAQSFTNNVTRCELRLVKAVVEEFLQKNGGTMTGDIDMDTNSITDAVLDGSSTQIVAGEIVGVPIRGDASETGNQFLVPSGGTAKPTVGGVDIVLEDDDFVDIFSSGGVLTLDPSTRLLISNTALRMQGSSSSDRFDLTTDDTDFTLVFTGIEDFVVSGLSGNIEFQDPLTLVDNLLIRPVFIDFSIRVQDKVATASTTIDYTAGSYVRLDLDTSITSLTLSNPPATGNVGTLRLKITKNAGSETIAWPASVDWPQGGTAPSLSTGAGDVDFVDLWTDDGGTTWYGAFNTNWE